MSGKVYEIMTKATLAKGTKKTISKHDYLVNDIDKILGCWICNHQYRGVIKQQPVIEGSFDLHIWYSHLNDSFLLKQKVTYCDVSDLNQLDNSEVLIDDCVGYLSIKNHETSQKDEVVVESLYLPRCIHAKLENKTVHLEIEKQMSLKIIGDTTILVESKNEETSEIDMKINQDFIT